MSEAPSSSEPLPIQFGVRQLLGLTWVIGCLLGGMLNGILFFSAAALPIALLGYGLLSGRFQRAGQPRKWLTLIVLAICLSLALSILGKGTPGDLMSWLMIMPGVIWTAAFYAFVEYEKKLLLVAALLMQIITTFICFMPESLSDAIGFREPVGIQVFQGTRKTTKIGAIFLVTDELNTNKIEKYVGFVDQDQQRDIHSIEAELLIYDPDFPDIMALLPDDNARKTVVASVLDEKNHMRYHQNLLLYALQAIGYPPEEPGEVWWARHKDLFAVEHDAARAAERVWGWGPVLESCVSSAGIYEMRFRRRYYAARAKEQKYSGNPKFVDAYYELSRSVARSPSLNAELTERNQRLFAW